MRGKEGVWESRKCQEWKAIINLKMPRRTLLHALTAGDHSDKPSVFVLARNGGRLCQPVCQSLCYVTLASNWNWRRKTRERFMSITFPFMAKILQNSLSFCLPYGEMMRCNTNNYFSPCWFRLTCSPGRVKVFWSLLRRDVGIAWLQVK